MKQHYLPECYLREFLNQDGKLNTLDLTRLQYGKKVFDEPKYPGEVCYGKDFYTIDAEVAKDNAELMNLEPYFIEHKFGEYETRYPKLIAKLKRGQSYLQSEDTRLLMLIILDLKMRNPYYREKVIAKNKGEVIQSAFNHAREQAQKWDDSFIRIVANQSKQEFLKEIDQRESMLMADEKYAGKFHLASLAKRKKVSDAVYETLSTHLLQFEWLLIRSNNAFITTDNPGFALDKENFIQNIKFGKDFFYFLPLTPSLCFAVSAEVIDKVFPKGNGKKLLTIVTADQKIIQTINEKHGYHLTRYVFANNSHLINQIASQVNAGIRP
jgi:hypothetical protein